MRIRITAVIVALSLFLAGYFFVNIKPTVIPKSPQNPNIVHFVAAGDSYTIGFDVGEDETWPTLLTKHLQSEGIQIELIKNLAVSGYTADDVIAWQLPEYERLNPQFATLLIGANDLSLEIDIETFRKNLIVILDTMQAKLSHKNNLVVLTIPDFTNTIKGRKFFSGDHYAKLVTQFNEVIKMEAGKRNLAIVDLQNINDGISFNESFYTADGLHPSGKQYKLWEQRIYPKVKAVLKKK